MPKTPRYLTPIFIFLVAAFPVSSFAQANAEKKTFLSYCQSPENIDERETAIAVLIEASVPSTLTAENCKFADEIIQKRTWLNLYPDPLDVPREKIKDLAPIASFSHIQTLSLGFNLVEDLTPLESFKNLLSINLNQNQVKDLSPLSKILNLKEILAPNNRLESIASIASLKRVTSLDFSNNQITDIAAVQKFKALDSLYLQNNLIVDATPVSSMGNLRYLNLAQNQLEALNLSASASSLLNVNLSYNPLSRLLGLEDATKLDALNLRHTNLDDLRKILKTPKNLRFIDVQETRITDLSKLGDATDLEFLYADRQQIDQLPQSVLDLQESHFNSKGKEIKLSIKSY